ncbi:BPL-N domain-containing protein [Amycolatopsis azurea]|uniref:BPL-N domain-containing protein n=1 Tax=Amycolatopsis azurea TaxID=36819 RepID=UPI0038109B3C
MNPLALVYRGPASLPGCPEAVAELLESSSHGFEVQFTGPDEEVPLCKSSLSAATLYAQPGGGRLSYAYRKLRRHHNDIRSFVWSGGRYLGFCLGAYLAGATPGFGLLPGDTDRYIDTEDSAFDHADDTVVAIRWRGRRRKLYFQDGPVFLLDSPDVANVLATYSNGMAAALVAPFGTGHVGVVGPHPEATRDWYTDSGLRRPILRTGRNLGLDLVDAVMGR